MQKSEQRDARCRVSPGEAQLSRSGLLVPFCRAILIIMMILIIVLIIMIIIMIVMMVISIIMIIIVIAVILIVIFCRVSRGEAQLSRSGLRRHGLMAPQAVVCVPSYIIHILLYSYIYIYIYIHYMIL